MSVSHSHVIHTGPSHVSLPQVGCQHQKKMMEKHLHPIDLQNSAGFQLPRTRRNWVPWLVWNWDSNWHWEPMGTHGNPSDSFKFCRFHQNLHHKWIGDSLFGRLFPQKWGLWTWCGWMMHLVAKIEGSQSWTCANPNHTQSSILALGLLIIHVHECSPHKVRCGDVGCRFLY